MPITEKQLEKRKKTLGSSDMAAVMGLDPWRNAHDVYLEKTQDLTPLKTNAAIDVGNYFEPGLLDWAQDKLGKLKRNQFRRLTGTWLAANIDAILITEGEPVEAKTNSMVVPDYARKIEDWGDDGTDQVPERILIQCHVHMLCINSKVCHVPVALGGRSLLMFRITFYNKIGDAVLNAADNFMTKNVKALTPPQVEPHYETASRIIKVTGKVAPCGTVAQDDFNRWDRINEAKKKVIQAERFAKAKIVAQLGDHDSTVLSDGRTMRMNLIEKKGHTVGPSSYRQMYVTKK